MMNIVFVGLGGFVGASIRYIISTYTAKIFVSRIPVGTLLVNILGGLIIGIIMELTIKTSIISPQLKLFLTTGLLGGLTTFSTFSYETVVLMQNGNLLFTILNIALNLFLSLGGVVLGKLIIH
ncbi:fluoride efflux transporter CrcB [Terrisporobacter sp.]